MSNYIKIKRGLWLIYYVGQLDHGRQLEGNAFLELGSHADGNGLATEVNKLAGETVVIKNMIKVS